MSNLPTIQELHEEIRLLHDYVGKLTYEVSSLRARYNRELGNVGRKMAKAEEIIEQSPVKRQKTTWDAWRSKLSAEDNRFIDEASLEDVTRLRTMVENGEVQ